MRPERDVLTAEELRKINAYWWAANYLSVGQIYLLDNPLLKERLERAHVKPRLLGHWGTTPGLNLCSGAGENSAHVRDRGFRQPSRYPVHASYRLHKVFKDLRG